MSTITIKLPQGELRWWKMRLPANEDGNIMMTHLNAAAPQEATEASWEIFDGCDGEMRSVVSAIHATDFNKHTLYVLSYRKPSDSPDWHPLEFVALYPKERAPTDQELDQLLSRYREDMGHA